MLKKKRHKISKSTTSSKQFIPNKVRFQVTLCKNEHDCWFAWKLDLVCGEGKKISKLLNILDWFVYLLLPLQRAQSSIVDFHIGIQQLFWKYLPTKHYCWLLMLVFRWFPHMFQIPYVYSMLSPRAMRGQYGVLYSNPALFSQMLLGIKQFSE